MKKNIIKSSLIATLFIATQTNAGIPTIDAGAIAQSIMQYVQMGKDFQEQIKQYQEMVKQTLNWEQQLQEMGVSMTDINQILGDTKQMIDGMKNIYNDIGSIPTDILGDIKRVENACSFLEQESKFFGMTTSKTSNKFLNRANRCIVSLSDGANIQQRINEIDKEINKTIDPLKKTQLQNQKSNIIKASQFLKDRDNVKRTSTLLEFQDKFYQGDANELYSQKRMKDDFNNLLKQTTKPKNQKEAQALTNSILLKLLEMTQMQYELNVQYTTAVASTQSVLNNKSKITEEDYQTQVVEKKRNDAIYKPVDKQLPKDELGMPKFVYFK